MINFNLKDTVSTTRKNFAQTQAQINEYVDNAIEINENFIESFKPEALLEAQKKFIMDSITPLNGFVDPKHVESAFDQFSEMCKNTAQLQNNFITKFTTTAQAEGTKKK